MDGVLHPSGCVEITFKQAPPPPPPRPPLGAGQTRATGTHHLSPSGIPTLASLPALEAPPGFHFMSRPFEI